MYMTGSLALGQGITSASISVGVHTWGTLVVGIASWPVLDCKPGEISFASQHTLAACRGQWKSAGACAA